MVGNGWQLVWNDEFSGRSVDRRKWDLETDCWGGGNNELQCYTDRPENSFLRNGKLVIRARSERFTGPAEPPDWKTRAGNRTLNFTSARLRSKGKGDWRYGRIEVRAKLPAGQGIWPAIWMLPTDRVYGGWPASGEIDIMEAVNLPPGNGRKRVYGTLHYGSEWPGQVWSGSSYQFKRSNPAAEFHTYALEWSRHEIRWYVDHIHYATQRSSDWYSRKLGKGGARRNAPGQAPFDQRFHLLLNVAVGGDWPGAPNNRTAFPVEMEVDFVRVFACAKSPEMLSGCETKNRRVTGVYDGVASEFLHANLEPDLPDPDVVAALSR